jgi:spore maturation protein CgeB
MSVAEQVALIQKSRINLNFGASCDYRAPIASGLPERCYGIPACGGFLLCDRRSHARDDFTPGVDWAEFDGLDDAWRRSSTGWRTSSAARELAERCHATVMARHTYAHRAASAARHAARLARWASGACNECAAC